MIANERDLAKAAAESLSVQYGEGVITVVEKAIKDGFPVQTQDNTRVIDWNTINNAASVIQIGSFVTLVAKWVWDRFKATPDKTSLKEAAKAQLTPPAGLTGEQRDRVIDTVIEKL